MTVLVGLDIVLVDGTLVVGCLRPVVGLDVLALILLHAIFGHELLLLEGTRLIAGIQVLDGLVTRNLPCSSSNTQAGMPSSVACGGSWDSWPNLGGPSGTSFATLRC